jgi:hypothetical protein
MTRRQVNEAEAKQAALSTGALIIEGQQWEQGDAKSNCMGVFEPMKPALVVNGRVVYQAIGVLDTVSGESNSLILFLYFGKSGEWFIGTTEADARAGKATGWLRTGVELSALTPNETKAGSWMVWHLGGWKSAPEVCVRQCSAEDKQAFMDQKQANEDAARQAAVDTGAIVIEGQEPGKPRSEYMGVYELMEPPLMVNGRAVYAAARGQTRFLYFASTAEWFVGATEADMRAGKGWGFLRTGGEPLALTPDMSVGEWLVSNGKGGWLKAPGISAVKCTAAHREKYEELARQKEERARKQALRTGAILLEQMGVIPAAAAECKGTFTPVFQSGPTLAEDALLMVNGRAVYARTALDPPLEGGGCSSEPQTPSEDGKDERFVYFACTGEWFVGKSRADMLEGRAWGLVRSGSEPSAVTPDQVKPSTWQAWTATPMTTAKSWTPAYFVGVVQVRGGRLGGGWEEAGRWLGGGWERWLGGGWEVAGRWLCQAVAAQVAEVGGGIVHCGAR